MGQEPGLEGRIFHITFGAGHFSGTFLHEQVRFAVLYGMGIDFRNRKLPLEVLQHGKLIFRFRAGILNLQYLFLKQQDAGAGHAIIVRVVSFAFNEILYFLR